MKKTPAIQHFPSVRLLYSNNVLCYEQQDAQLEIRTFVLVCCQGKGFVVVLRREPGQTYQAVKQWTLQDGAGLSFHMPYQMTYALDVRLLEEMVRSYRQNPNAWTDLDRSTRFDGLMPITRGTTES